MIHQAASITLCIAAAVALWIAPLKPLAMIVKFHSQRRLSHALLDSNMSALARAVNQASRQAGRAMSTEVAGIKKVRR